MSESQARGSDRGDERPNAIAGHHTVELVVRRRLVIIGVIVIGFAGAAAMLLLDYFVNYSRWTELGPIRRLFNATREDALASWLMVSLTLIAALAAWLMFITVVKSSPSKWRKIGWLVLALMLSYMCADDGAKIHERLGSAAAEAQEDQDGEAANEKSGTLLDAFPSYDWQVVVGPFFAAMGVFMLVFLGREAGDWTGRLMLVTALGLFTVAVGLDFIEGLDRDHRWNLYTIINERFDLDLACVKRFRQKGYETLRHFSKTLEESIEICGMTLMLAVILRTWMRQAEAIVVRFADGARPAR